jgi:ubiquinone/menaquinone biosynthesis C-methylase UbiE
MDKNFEQRYHEVEKFHWWFRARREIILKLLAGVPKDASILDVGCSGGAVLQALKVKGFNNVTGIDVSEEAIQECHQQGFNNTFTMDAKKLRWKDNEFDVLIASDVLEHIEESKAALAEWNRVLKRNGVLIVFVPAFQFLWSNYDTVNNHFKRYTKSDLVALLKNSDFKISRSSYWNMFLFLPIALVRLGQKKMSGDVKTKVTEDNFNPSFNNLFLLLLRFENWLLSIMNFPWGVSVFALARKERSG